MAARMPEATGSALAFAELIDDFKVNLSHGDKHHLRNAIAYGNLKGGLASIPQGDKNLPLVIRIDQPDQIPKDDAMLVPQARARQQNGGQRRITDMNGESRRDEVGFTGLKGEFGLKAGTKVQARRTVSGIFRQRNLAAQAGIKQLKLNVLHGSDGQSVK